MDLDARAFNVNAHINEHVRDIQQIFQVFKAGRGTRTPMQRLPRHMRRRAMSHNVNRMPRNWRKFAYQATKKSKHRKKPPSRFARRRRKFQDGGDPSLLGTHRWHAKRYKMIKAFGTKLPFNCYQKVKRSCVRNATSGCCVVDHSYWKQLEVIASKECTQALSSLANLPKLPSFEDDRFHELVLYKPNPKIVFRNCIGPVIIKKKRNPEAQKEELFEISCHPVVFSLLMDEMSPFEPRVIADRARLTFYGPESLDKIVESLRIKETISPDDMFADLLDGAVIVEPVSFHLTGKLDDKVTFEFELFYKSVGLDMVLDMVFDRKLEKDVFYKFVHNKCRVLGLSDEYNVRCSYGLLNFPEDALDSSSFEFVAAELEELKRKHGSRPPNRRVNFELLSREDPFSFELEGTEAEELVPIKIVPVRKGVPERLGFVYSEVYEDEEEEKDVEMDVDVQEEGRKYEKLDEFVEISVFLTSRFKSIVPMSRLFDIVEHPKESKRMKKRLNKEKSMVEPPEIQQIPQGKTIGRIVRGLRWTSRHGAYYGFAYCSRTFIDELDAKDQDWIFFRNINSRVYRKANFVVLDSKNRFF